MQAKHEVEIICEQISNVLMRNNLPYPAFGEDLATSLNKILLALIEMEKVYKKSSVMDRGYL